MDQAKLQQTYSSALEKLSEGKADQAAEDFAEIDKTGFTSAEFEYYYARALLLNKEPGKAVLHYEKAVAYNRLNSDFRKELELARQAVPSGYGSTLQHPWEWSHALSSYIRTPELFFIGGSFLLALLVSRYLQSKLTKLTASFLVLCVVFLSLGCFSFFHVNVQTLNKETSLREAPIESASTRKTLPTGSRVRVLRRESEHSEVQRQQHRGWVPNKNLEKAF